MKRQCIMHEKVQLYVKICVVFFVRWWKDYDFSVCNENTMKRSQNVIYNHEIKEVTIICIMMVLWCFSGAIKPFIWHHAMTTSIIELKHQDIPYCYSIVRVRNFSAFAASSSTLRSCDLHGAARFAILAPPPVILSRITPPCTLVRCARCNCVHSVTSHG